MLHGSVETNEVETAQREKTVLAELKRRLNVNKFFTNVMQYTSREDEALIDDAPETSFTAQLRRQMVTSTSKNVVDGYLMRFLKDKQLSTTEAISKLRRRRTFERTLPTISISPTVISALRSGAFRVIGKDYQHRWILYFNINDYNIPPLEVDDAERLVMVLLEYMQALCMAVADEDAAFLSTNPTVTAADSATSQTIRKGPRENQQQFVILINEEGGSFRGHVPLLQNAYNIYTIISKYYPALIDEILIVGAAFDVRQGIKAALATSPKDVQKMFVLLQPDDLLRYMEADVIPKEWNETREKGREKHKKKKGKHITLATPFVATGTEFAEAVLRNWYTLTSYIVAETTLRKSKSVFHVETDENESGKTGKKPGANLYENSLNRSQPRPLFVPLPYLLNVQEVVALQRAAFASKSLARHQHFPRSVSVFDEAADNASPLPLRARRTSGSSTTPPMSYHSTTSSGRVIREGDSESDSFLARPREVEEDDGYDGLLSAISDSATSRADMDEEEALDMGSDTSEEIVPLGGDEFMTAEEIATIKRDGGGGKVLGLLHRERRHNAMMKKELRVLQFGVTYDPSQTTAVEQQLAAVHQEVNALVANVVVRAKGASRGRPDAAPSLKQLLDATIVALGAASGEPDHVPALNLAVPVQREPPTETCCSVM
ncbi:hypothetical protein AGDE_12106 [Angomonas deanei]|uniref:CRAL/TRIO domain containing protein, putative n=1 Tax=Angomonas deanei TaxID=59799 RepID=A0A7G2CJJ2_9TRYP|nr:hypothetical protein AGDE_12106 [Angomonas deanei]CAD2218432.1 CRAL/TRIO domain containing protein, putative [Angomonas deanei]|eukprot:EPY24919.1 hypothetical protein AGDE_12106 [Angomonas deanei]